MDEILNFLISGPATGSYHNASPHGWQTSLRLIEPTHQNRMQRDTVKLIISSLALLSEFSPAALINLSHMRRNQALSPR